MSNKNIVLTAGLISLLTLVSKCIGFIREMVMAGYYGTSEIADIYVLSNTIPTSILDSVFMAIATAYMPLLAEKVGLDPAVMASPFISTIVDATSLLIYFSFASALLGI